jgi:tRNA threonylcarbamoyladenosine biosynthesis protein TsaB
MKILSLDSSGSLFSIALMTGNQSFLKTYPANKENSENLLSEIRLLLKENSFEFSDLDGITFGAGPGSFTGVRVACGIAYGIAYAQNLPILGINTLEAYAAIHSKPHTISCIDARMNQVYIAGVECINNAFNITGEMMVVDPDKLPYYQCSNPIIIGSGVRPYAKEIKKQYDHLNPIIDDQEYALAEIMANLAKNRFAKDFNLAYAQPIYVRDKVAYTIKEREAD